MKFNVHLGVFLWALCIGWCTLASLSDRKLNGLNKKSQFINELGFLYLMFFYLKQTGRIVKP